MPTPTFSSRDRFTAFLELSDTRDQEDDRFPARNFRLDPRASAARADDYDGGGALSPADIDAWAGHHRSYLARHVWRSGTLRPQRRLDPRHPDRFAETFTDPATRSGLEGKDPSTRLVRVEDLQHMRTTVGLDRDAMKRAFEGAVRGDAAARRAVSGWLRQWPRDLRPTFAAPFKDVADLLPEDEAAAPRDWEEKLRDRLGLLHYRPDERGPREIDIAVFVYSFADIPKILGLRGAAAVHTPTVLDSDLNPAFCPAPPACTAGHAVDLSNDERDDAAKEVLHPPLADLTAEFLYRVGTVRTMPGAADSGAMDRLRGWHIFVMRQASGDDTFAEATDDDLL